MFDTKFRNICVVVFIVPVCNAILNGTPLQPGQCPYNCILKTKNIGSTGFFGTCACAIIGEEWVLTAAHCVASNDIESMLISYGSQEFNDINRLSQEVPRSNVVYIPLLYIGLLLNQK